MKRKIIMLVSGLLVMMSIYLSIRQLTKNTTGDILDINDDLEL